MPRTTLGGWKVKKTIRGRMAGCKRTRIALASGNYIRTPDGKVLLHPTEGKITQHTGRPGSRKHKRAITRIENRLAPFVANTPQRKFTTRDYKLAGALARLRAIK